MTVERRQSKREPVIEPGMIYWQNAEGMMLQTKLVLLNLSAKGVMLEIREKLPLRQLVTLKVPALQIDLSATVRYCRQQGTRYRIGLELFSTPAKNTKPPRWT